MTSTTKARKPANSVITSPLSIKIPGIDVASYVFSAGSAVSRAIPQYYDAETPAFNFSLAEAEVYVKRFGKGLQDHGLRPSDRVLLFSGNTLYFPIVLWSVAAAGGIFTAASPAATSLELEYQLRDSGACFLITSPEGLPTALKAAKKANLPCSRIFTFGHLDAESVSSEIHRWTDLWCSNEAARGWKWKRIDDIQEASNTTVVINYSSGTTGLPKGVELSHYNLVANSEQVLHKRTLRAKNASGKAREARLRDSGERWIAALPMYHAFGQTYASLSAARCGAKVYIMPHFTLPRYMQFLDIYRITFMTTVPTILNMMNKYPHPERYNLAAIEVVTSGSAPLDSALAAGVASQYLRRGVQVKQGWGMTETTCSVCGFSPDDEDDGGSIGWLNPNCAAKIVPVDNSRDNTSPPSSDATQASLGEIWVAGPQMMKGYWRKPQQTSDVVVEEDEYRWIRTGDIGYIDHRGCLYIVDRLKVCVNRRRGPTISDSVARHQPQRFPLMTPF
jgi:4-coumarate--CoA ligase